MSEPLAAKKPRLIAPISLIIFFTALILFWVFSIKYIREKYYEINKIPDDESVSKKKRKSKRKGKYVKVSELKRKKKASGDEEKESEEGVSLDDLIAKKKED